MAGGGGRNVRRKENTVGLSVKCKRRKEVRDGLNEDGGITDIVIMIMIMTYLVFE